MTWWSLQLHKDPLGFKSPHYWWEKTVQARGRRRTPRATADLTDHHQMGLLLPWSSRLERGCNALLLICLTG